MADAMHAVQNMKSFATQAIYGQESWEFLPPIGKVNAVMTGVWEFLHPKSKLMRKVMRVFLP